MDWYAYEKQAMSQGCRAVCGIDEAGRGPLAGPVCAAAVILPVDCELPGLDDFKKLTEKKRELLFPLITQKALAYGIGWANAEEIDRLNILQATFPPQPLPLSPGHLPWPWSERSVPINLFLI